jgi:amino acid transporter
MASEVTGRELLKPKVGYVLMLAMAVGIIVGPWMPQMPLWFSLSGPSSALAFIAIALVCIPIIFAYGELTAMLPFAGGEYNFARSAFGYRTAWLTGWFLILLYIMATAFQGPCTARMIQALLMLPDIPEITIALTGIGLLLIFTILNTFTVSISAMVQLIMVLVMMAVGIGESIWFFTSGQWMTANIQPFFSTGLSGWLICVGILVTMVIGFDCIPQLAEEVNYPRRRQMSLMLASVIISELFFALIVFACSGMLPTEQIIQMIVVDPEIARALAGNIPPIIINLAGIFATLTCLNGFMIAASRVIFAMGRANVLPPVFARCNKFNVPYVAIWAIFGVCALLVGIGGEVWLMTIFIAAAFATGIIYTLVAASAARLRKTHPEWPRPIKMPGGMGMGILGAILGLGIMVAVAFGMPMRSWVMFGVWIVIGIIIYSWVVYKRRKDATFKEVYLTPADIPEDRAA